jgi:hypothetical protein
MDGKSILWICYVLGFALPFFLKFAHYMYIQDRTKISFGEAFLKWFFGGTEESVVTVSTFGFVWLLGGIYIDRLEFIFGSDLRAIPYHPSIAFFLGAIGEILSPIAIKWVSKRLFPE